MRRPAAALEAALRRFDALEGRLRRVLERLGGHGVGVSEQQFAALLDHVGSSTVRERMETLVEAFPD